jgi:hypothetical protein
MASLALSLPTLAACNPISLKKAVDLSTSLTGRLIQISCDMAVASWNIFSTAPTILYFWQQKRIL